MLGDMCLWLVANLKQGVIYFIKQACGNDKRAGVYLHITITYHINIEENYQNGCVLLNGQ